MAIDNGQMHFSLKNKKLVYWLLGGFFIKLILFCIYVYAFKAHWPPGDIVKGISLTTPDTEDYYQPIERLLKGEGYSLAVITDTYPPEAKVVPWSYRMPGLLPIYAPLYILFGSGWGRALVIVLQLVCELLSVLLLARTAASVFKNISFFYLCLILYILNSFVSVYTIYANSESFCISFFIFSFYFLFRYLETLNSKQLFLAGLFLCWSIFFRPVVVFFLPVYVLIIFYSCYVNKKLLWKQAILRLVIMLSVFGVADSIWIYRNNKTFHQFIPLNGGFEAIATKQELTLYKMIIAWGGDIQNWNPSEGRWFIRPSDSKTRVYDPEFQSTNPFHSFIFTPDYNLDSLKKLRTIYWRAFPYSGNTDSALYYRDLFVAKAEGYISSFKKHRPFHYHVVSKLLHAKTFVLIKRPYALPFIGKSPVEKAIRVLSVVYYYLMILLGTAGILLAWFRKGQVPAKLFSLGVLLFIGMHSYFGYTEFRYFLPVYPVFTLYAAYCLYGILQKIRSQKNISVQPSL